MATSPEYVTFILDQLSDLGKGEASCRAMMGEYVLYYHQKVAGGLYNNRLMIKAVPSAVRYLESVSKAVVYEIPYPGAKEMLFIQDVEDRAFLTGLFPAIYDELAFPKPRKKRPPKNQNQKGNP